MMVQDIGRPFSANVIINGTANVFDLPVETISQTMWPPVVVLGGVVISGASTPTYYFDYKYGVIGFYTPPQPAGATLGVSGHAYDYFTDAEVQQAVTDAFNLHTNDLDPPLYIDPVLGQMGVDSNNEYMISILAAVELLWFRSTDAAQEVDIHTPEGVSIPRSQRYEQIMQQIERLNAAYEAQSGALGTGLYRIQVLNQRRVSYTTNRLVPIFREQEYNQPYTGFMPTTGLPGSLITIQGKYFTATTDVTFGGVSCNGQFTVVSDSEVQAIVPANAMTGQIGVITPYGVVLSTAQFVVGEPPPFILYGPEQVKIPIPPGK
jgi:IPT/TIG domain